MEVEIRLPQWGMGMREGTIVAWFKSEGDVVEEGEPLVEVEADKVSKTVNAPVAGVLTRVLAHPEDTVPVRSVLATIRTDNG